MTQKRPLATHQSHLLDSLIVGGVQGIQVAGKADGPPADGVNDDLRNMTRQDLAGSYSGRCRIYWRASNFEELKGPQPHLATLLLKGIDVVESKEWVGLQDLPCQQQSCRSEPESVADGCTSTDQRFHGTHVV